MRGLLISALLLGGVACDAPARSTPHARIERFTGCPVPSTVVQLHDHIGGDASEAVTHAKLVLPKDQLREFLRGCGTSVEALQPAFDPSGLEPSEPLDFWTIPDRQVIRGGAHSRAGTATTLILHERDTDVAVYLYARRSER